MNGPNTVNAALAPHLAHQLKRRREVVTPEGIALPLTVAARSARLGALLLDFLIIGVSWIALTLLLIWIFSGSLDALEQEAGVSGAAEFLIILFIIMTFLARYAYFLYFELGPRGATLGKRATGIRVAARDGGRLTAEAIIARNLLRDIEIFLPLVFIFSAPSGQTGNAGIAAAVWFLIFALFPFFNRDAMRAGDLVAGTWVVEAPRSKLQDTLATQAAAAGTNSAVGGGYVFAPEELEIYGEYELQTLERVLRNDNADAIIAVQDTICRKIGWNSGAGDERAFLEAFYAQLRARLEGDMRFGKRKADKFS